MLDTKELEKQFDQLLDAFTDKDLLDWLENAEQREKLQKLQQADVVKAKPNAHQIGTVHREVINEIAL